MRVYEINNSDASWKLDKPEMTISNPHVTGNGNQQVLVRFYVEASVPASAVKLTESEKESITIVDYYDSEIVIPFNEYNDYGWKSSRVRDDRYNYFSPSFLNESPESNNINAGGERFDFYISCNDANASPLKIAVKITGDNGKVFITNGDSYGPSGEPIATNYKLSLTPEITVHTPVYYDASRFFLSAPVGIAATRNSSPHAAIFNHGIYLSLSPDGSRQLALRELVAEPSGMIHWQTPDVDDRTPCFIGFANPGETNIGWHPDKTKVPTGNQPLPKLTAGDVNHDKCLIIMCGRNDIRQGDYPSNFDGPCSLRVTDVHGTPHNLKLSFIPRKRDEIILSN